MDEAAVIKINLADLRKRARGQGVILATNGMKNTIGHNKKRKVK